MSLLKSELIFYGIGTTLIITFSTLFYFDVTKRVEAGDAEVVGSITYSRQNVQRKYAAQVIWEDVIKDTPVYNNDSIRTAEMSETVIKLKDKTEITLAENSLIMLSFSKDEIEIDFSHGSAKAKRGDVKGGDEKKLLLKTKDTTVAMGKSDISVSQDRGKELSLTVNKGNAVITTKKGEKVIKEDQKLIVTKEDEKVYTLNLKLNSPAPNMNFISKTGIQNITFSWEPVKGDYDVFLEISSSFSFATMAVARKVTGLASSAALSQGVYYWRLRAKNRKTKKFDLSDTRRLEVVSDEPVQLISPRNGSLVSYTEKLPIIYFKWLGSGSGSGYKLVIAGDQAMNNVVRSIQLPAMGNSIAVDKLAKGTYFWKVVKSVNLGESPHLTSSSIFKLVIDEKKQLDPPELVYPPDNKPVNKLALKNNSLSFTWRKSPEIPASKFVVSTDSGFSNVVFTATSKVNFAKLTKELGVGKYFWRVIGTSDIGDINLPSSARSFRVIEETSITLVEPRDNALIGPRGEQTNPSVTFAWKRTELNGRFSLLLSKNKSFSSVYRTTTVDGFSKTIGNIEPGKYYWKVNLYDNSGTKLLDSSPFSIEIREKLRRPLALTPQQGDVVDMKDKNSLELSWKRLDGANLYRIRLVNADNNQQVVALDTRNTNYRIDDLSKLDVGKFYWTLQALETYGGSGNIIRQSPVSRMNFEIKLGDSKGKPEIKIPKTIFVD